MSSTVEEGKSQLSQTQRKIKDLQQELQDQQDRTQSEIQLRLRADKQRTDLTRELNEQVDRLDHISGQLKVCNFDVHIKILHNTTIKIETIKNMHTLL